MTELIMRRFTAQSSHGWPQALALLAALQVLVLGLYGDTARSIVEIWWRSETFAHAFLVPPIVAWLIWRRRHELAAHVPRPNAWLLLPIAGAASLWLLGDLVGVNAVTQLAFVALLVLVAVAVLGLPASRTILFPLGFLFFAVPIGEFLMPQLMAATADFTVAALRLSGIPVYREGLQFVIPSGNWSVVEACSGVRYLIASLVVGTLFAYLNFRSLRRRLIFVGVSILVPIVANWLRAYFIVLLGHLSSNELATGADHLVYGWLFFGIVMAVMFLIGGRWAATAEPVQPVAAVPVRPRVDRSPLARNRVAEGALSLALALLVVLPHLTLRSLSQPEDRQVPQLVAPGTLADGWRRSDEPVSDWQPAFKQPSAEIRAGYASSAGRVGVYVGYYMQQNYERKLVSSVNTLVPAEGPWVAIDSGTRRVSLAGAPVTVRTARLRGSRVPGGPEEVRLLVWQVYWVNGQLMASDAQAKLQGALSRLLGRGDDAAVILLHTQDDAPGGADRLLEAFAQTHLPALQRQLEAAREGRSMGVASKETTMIKEEIE